jgi:RNA polymerase sigma-70 factor (ECF subfamily)
VTPEQFDDFYGGSVARITGQVYLMIGDLEEAQDVVQEAFVRAWDRRRQLEEMEHPEAWVRTVAYRLAVSRWRIGRNALIAWRRRAPDASADPPGIEHLAIVAALRRIPEAQRRTIVLHHLCDRSAEQVAEETGVPVGTVKARLSRGRAAMRQHLTTEQPSEATRD